MRTYERKLSNTRKCDQTKTSIVCLLCMLTLYAYRAKQSLVLYTSQLMHALYTFNFLCLYAPNFFCDRCFVYYQQVFVIVSFYNIAQTPLYLKIKFCCPRGVRQNKSRKCRTLYFFLLNASSFFGSFRFGRGEDKSKCLLLFPFVVCCKC